MKLYSTGQRSYIVDPKKVVSGGAYRKEDYEKKYMYIDPKAKFEVTDEYGAMLLKMYPDQFMELDGAGKIPFEAPAKKAKAKIKIKAKKRKLVMA